MVFIHEYVVFALGVFLLEAGWEALVFYHFSQPPVLIVPFSFYTSLCFLSFVHVQDRHSKTDTCPISLYPEWLGVVVKAGEYGSVRCRVLNGSKGSFPWSLYFPAYPFLLAQIFQIFSQVVSVPFLPFLLMRSRTCRGLNRPRLCPKTILYLF